MIRISLSDFRLDLLDKKGEVARSFPVSWSRYGVGVAPDSKKTPTGRFRICEKIGASQPSGAVFEGRKPTGEVVTPAITGPALEGRVLSRILWLEGLDKENRNTKKRHIYIHGTINEFKVPSQFSDGCITMRNEDVIALFDLVEEGEQVVIQE